MQAGSISDKCDQPAYSWEDFTSGILLNASFGFDGVSFDNGFSCAPTAVTAINSALISRAISSGETGIVIAVSDYQKEALSYSLSVAIDSAKQAGESRNSPLPDNACHGSLLCFDDVVVRYLGEVIDSDFGDCAKFVYNGVTTRLPIAKLPILHHCTSQDRSSRARNKLGLGTLSARHRNRDGLERAMLDGCSSIPSAIGLAIPTCRVPNSTPTQLSKGKLCIAGKTNLVADILPSAHYSGETKLKINYNFPADITPALVLSSRDAQNAGRGKLSDFLNYLDDGGALSSVVVELDNESAIDDGYINDIIDITGSYHVPVIIFCDLVTANSRAFEDELHFPVVNWGARELKSVQDTVNSVGSSLSLSSQQANYLQRFGSVMLGYTEPSEGVNDAAHELFEIVDSNLPLPDREQDALIGLLRLFGQMLRRTCVCGKTVAQKTSVQLAEIEDRLCGSKASKTLSPAQTRAIANICGLLRRLTRKGEIPPKQEKVWERVEALEGDPLYLVVSNAGSRDEERRYWRHALEYGGKPLDSLTVLSLHEFMRTDLSKDSSYTILSGWFNREEIGRILMSGNSKTYYSLLYTGGNLESAWRQKAEKYWNGVEQRASKTNISSLKRLGISQQFSDSERADVRWHDQVSDEPSVLENLSDALRMASSQTDAAPHREYSAVPARPVYFTNGDVCWLECSEAHHARLITVTDCLSADGEPVRKSASLLESGDVVLKIDNDDDLVSDASSHSKDYAEMLAQARAWHKPIEEARLKNQVLPGQAVRLIQASGCKRGKQTIRKWVVDDSCIAPDDDNDIRAIGKAFNAPFSDEDIKRMRTAEKICLGKRISKGRSVTNESMRLFIEEARNGNSFEAAEQVFAEAHSDQGELRVFYVDWVGDERGTTRRGWYTG